MTQIDIAALVADLTESILGVERDHDQDMADAEFTGERPELHEQEVTIPLAQATAAVAALIAQDAELKRYREALTEAKETLVEVKRDMWREAAPRWIMADFLNWAIVQRITASIVSTRAALGEKP